MNRLKTGLAAGILLASLAARAQEKLPQLKVGDERYTNVTVTSVTATDIYFTYAGGMGNAKLKNLDPEAQAHFHFDAGKASVTEQAQLDATAQYKKNLLTAQAEAKDRLPAPTYETGDMVVPKIYAHSYRGLRPPSIIVDQWLTPMPPNPEGKFVMVLFWITSAEQCRSVIPRINDFSERFKDRLITFGLSNEPLTEMVKMTEPKVHFFTGTDTQSRTFLSYEVTALPHLLVIDPKGIVRFEGPPIYLGEKELRHLLDTYGP